MPEAEPWSYHVDGSPVYPLADIIAPATASPSSAPAALSSPRSCTARPSAGDLHRGQQPAVQPRGAGHPGRRRTARGRRRPAGRPLVADVGTLGFDCDTLITDLDYLAWRDYARPHDPGEQAAPDKTALILYTSGTTGVPKGVELTGRNLGCALHELHASIELDEGSVCAAPVPFFHVAGLGMLLAANLNGGSFALLAC